VAESWRVGGGSIKNAKKKKKKKKNIAGGGGQTDVELNYREVVKIRRIEKKKNSE